MSAVLVDTLIIRSESEAENAVRLKLCDILVPYSYEIIFYLS
jgi:hypothetical protein